MFKMLKKALGAGVLFCLLLLVCEGCVSQQVFKLRRTDQQVSKYVKKHLKPLVADIRHVNIEGVNMRIIRIGDTALPVTLMVHGSPSSSTEFDMFLKDTTLVNKTCFLIIEKPGYGFSDFGKVDTSVVHQAVLINKAARPYLTRSKYNIMGNSYGGPVAAALAALDSSRVDKLILSVSAIAPGEEKIYGISKPLESKKWLRSMVPVVFKTANKEKLTHRAALEELKPLLSSVHARVWMIHGDRDKLIYYSNTAYGKAMFKGARSFEIITIHKGHHPLYWTHTQTMKKILLQILTN